MSSGSGSSVAPFDDFQRQRALEVALQASRASGRILLEHLGQLDPARVRSKSAARDLVTEADVASEREFVARLREALPTHAIEAEEEVRDAPEVEPANQGRPRWFLDPLDGTVNFVHRLPMFAVSAGLWVGDAPQVAVVHLPLLDETFHATRGGGAFLNGEPISVSATARLEEAVLATGFPYRRHELEHDNLANFGRFFHRVRGLRRMGSAAIDLAYVAAGRLDGYWELHLSPHDVAAGALLVREAGGLVSDVQGGETWLRRGSVVAAGPGLHGTLLESVEDGRS